MNEIDQSLIHYCEGNKVLVLVDLSRVNYISSIGFPMLINTAKSVFQHGGRMALLRPQKNVADVLEMVGINLIIPVFEDLQSAKTQFLAD